MKKKTKQRVSGKRYNFGFEKLEPKRCLASVGWDGAGQGGAELSYYLGEAPADVGQATFESVIEQALEVWSGVADVTFTETAMRQQNDSLDITFASLDGAGGVLAQAYFPDDVNRSRIAGDVQFDISENWEVGNQQGSRAFDLLYVAVHEIGHALGLEHSDAPGSVLADTVSPNQQYTSLSSADRDAALALYAPAELAPVDSGPVGPVEPQEETEGAEEVPAEPEENPVDQPTENQDDNDSTDEDSERRNRRRGFRRGGFSRFRFFNFFDGSFEMQVDLPEISRSNGLGRWFSFRVIRFFR